MPGIVRVGLDSHVGHASPSPNGFHQTAYAEGSPNVYVNGAKVVRIGDTTGCGDPAIAGSPNVWVNGIKVHRLDDGTAGHGSWVPNAATTSSTNVFANGDIGDQGDGAVGSTATNNTVTGAIVESTPELQMATSPFTQTVTSTCAAYNFTIGACED